MTTKSKNNQDNEKGYTATDSDQFLALMDQLNHVSVGTSVHDRDSKTIEQRQTNYSETDQAAFGELMGTKLQTIFSHEHKNKSDRKTRSVDGYSAQDNQQFDALMEFGSLIDSTNFSYSTDSSETDFAVPKNIDSLNSLYTDQDLQAFDELSIGGVDATTATKNPNDVMTTRSSTDRDVGPIKIIDFDQRRSAQAHSEDKPNENVKILFFD